MKWRMIHSWYRANVDSSSWMWNSDLPWLSWFLNINSLGPWFSIIVAKIHVFFFLNERSLSWRKYWSRPCQREPKNEWCKSCGALVFLTPHLSQHNFMTLWPGWKNRAEAPGVAKVHWQLLNWGQACYLFKFPTWWVGKVCLCTHSSWYL